MEQWVRARGRASVAWGARGFSRARPAACFGELFFFSSRRRHTRYWRDWSSDVCSSDLAPATPEHFPDADPGTMAINYRNAPFQYRQSKNGQATDPAHVFSSTVHGDPMTPLLEAYSEDPVRIRAIQGSQEEQHVMSVHGMRWREEPDDPNSPLIDSKAIGISEAFNFHVPKITCGANEAKIGRAHV